MARKLKWYKRDCEAALTGMLQLSLEERGAYNTILDLLYIHGGELPDDDTELARMIRADIRVWKRIKQRLQDLGKLYSKVVDNAVYICNGRVDNEIFAATSGGSSAEVPRSYGHSYTPKSPRDLAKNNDLGGSLTRARVQNLRIKNSFVELKKESPREPSLPLEIPSEQSRKSRLEFALTQSKIMKSLGIDTSRARNFLQIVKGIQELPPELADTKSRCLSELGIVKT